MKPTQQMTGDSSWTSVTRLEQPPMGKISNFLVTVINPQNSLHALRFYLRAVNAPILNSIVLFCFLLDQKTA